MEDPSPPIGPPPGIAALEPAGVYERLGTRPEGLTAAEVTERRLRFGANSLARGSRRLELARDLASGFLHPMALLLWISGAVAFIAGMGELGVAIILVVLINGLFSFWQEFKADRAVEALHRILPTLVQVRRNGEEHSIAAEELVPGDIILVGEGDRLPADARLVESAELRVDESTLTGESHPVAKEAQALHPSDSSRHPFRNTLRAGSTVVSGKGSAVVAATGMNTEFGRIARLTQTLGRDLSPLQREIQRVTRVVTLVAVGTGALFFLLALVSTPMGAAQSFLFALGLIVAFVPEGLLPTVTLSLAVSMQRMAKRNAIVKRLSAAETLGCATVICTDKTGTLTENAMTVERLCFGSGECVFPNEAAAREAAQRQPQKTDVPRDLLRALALCNNAHPVSNAQTQGQPHFLGDPTEAALLHAANRAGLDAPAETLRLPRVREFPFDAHRRRMSTIHRDGEGLIVFLKGAPREVLERCTALRDGERDVTLDDTLRRQVLDRCDVLAREGYRLITAAVRCLSPGQATDPAEVLESKLTFLGFAALEDPPRPDVLEAIERCRTAGIRVIMITGDYGLTALGIAGKTGLTAAGSRVIEGDELDLLDEPALESALRSPVLFARATPEHKLRVVEALKRMGEIVAVTGDGVNDAPALKTAHIGVAMGRSGTEAAKEAADIILTDDHFASIVSAIEEGRAVFANIRRFTSYIFTSNTPEAVPFILHALSGGRIPLALNLMQILAVDLGTDLVPALALGAERPQRDIMMKPPRRLDEHVITGGLLRRAYLWLGPWQSLAALAAFYFHFWTNGYAGQWTGLPGGGVHAAATGMTLGCIVSTQIGNLFAQRASGMSWRELDWFGNRLACLGIAVELLLLAAILYVPALQRVFGTAPIPALNWVFLFAWIPLLPLVDRAWRRWIARPRTPSHCSRNPV